MAFASKQIIVFNNEGTYMIMFNPEIIKKSGLHDTEGDAFLGSTVLENANSIRLSKCNDKPPNSKLGQKLHRMVLRLFDKK